MAEPPAEEIVFRPRRLRILVIIASVGLVGLCGFGWFAFPADTRALVSWSQRLTLFGILAALIITMIAIASSSVRADASGVRLRNGLRTSAIGWDRVHKIILRPGDPWGLILVKPADGRPFEADLDAEKRQVMGIQANDGLLAQQAIEALRERHRRFVHHQQ